MLRKIGKDIIENVKNCLTTDIVGGSFLTIPISVRTWYMKCHGKDPKAMRNYK